MSSDVLQQAQQLHQAGQTAQAQSLLQEYLTHHADAEAWYLLAGVYGAQQRFELAEQACREAVSVNPNMAKGYYRLANSLDAQGLYQDAVTNYERALQLQPDMLAAWHNMAMSLMALNELSAAQTALEQALSLQPDNTQVKVNLAHCLAQSKQIGPAMAYYRELLAQLPHNVELTHHLVLLYLEQGDYVAARDSLQDALQSHPDDKILNNDLGVVFMALGEYDRAQAQYEKLLDNEPGDTDILCNLGLAKHAQHLYGDALTEFDRARQLQPQHAEANWYCGLTLLLMGDYERGWPLYEYRWQRGRKHLPDWARPIWQDEDINGKRLLIFTEQGFGDALQFARYLSLLQQRGAQVIVRCQAALQPLFAALDSVHHCVREADTLPAFDLCLPMASLPLRFQTRFETVPDKFPYLSVPEGDYKAVHARIDQAKDAYKIGLFWRGSQSQVNDRRPCPLRLLSPLSKLPAVQLFALQKEIHPDDRALVESMGMIDLSPTLDDFGCTAAAIDRLDLVITIDSAVAHLAGALDAPVWVLLPDVCDWRWAAEGDSPWYPKARIFRQTEAGQWSAVVARVLDALRLARRN